MMDERLERAACAPVLLVATDYDGTLAPIVEDPSEARPHREALVAVQSLAALGQTHVAVISGRSLRDLAELTGAPPEVHLVGSHGSEFDPDFAKTLSAGQSELRDRVASQLAEIAARSPGLLVEEKPASIAFHYRNAAETDADSALEAVFHGPGSLDGVHTRHGKKVVELAVVETNKGSALDTLRRRVGASATVFFGDDKTDEDAFATLRGPDVGIKVGDGESCAEFRVSDPMEVAQVLARLSESRRAWLEGARSVPIRAHSALSDQRTVALVTPEASVSWWCAPRVDSPALFGEIVGGPTAGWFGVRPVASSAPPVQRYEDHTMLLRTRWDRIEVLDYLDCSAGRPTQRAGRSDLVRVVTGSGRVRITFAPRLDFGRVPTKLGVREGGIEVEDTADPVVLYAPGVEWTITEEGPHECATAEVELHGRPLVLELRFGTGHLGPSVVPEAERRRQTERFWRDWSLALDVPDVSPELVRRSALALKALCYGPTGSIAAAATTSLPEHIGGVRNWDYRYCWPRDASLAAHALLRLGSQSEAMRLLDWCLNIVDNKVESADRLQPLYTITGHEVTPEADLTELNGYGGSRPVRVGNAASRQVQLDVFGPVVDLVHDLLEHGAPLSSEHWRLVESMVTAVAHRWIEPDHGIWEMRMERRHHVHSKAMCWVTADRGARIAERLLGRERRDWRELADEIRADVLEHGFNAEVGAFTTAYGERDIDAATLLVGLCGLVDPLDERFVATVEAVQRELREGPVVYRYHFDDGLPGEEGGFHLCTAWLVESLAAIGRVGEARDLFEQMCALAGPTGLLSEEYCPKLDRSLGNHPQAYSHLGVVNAALSLVRSI